MRIDLFRMQCLKSIADYGSYEGASQDLEISTENLRKLIVQFEAELGFKLFKEDAEQMSLTTSGMFFYNKAKVIKKIQKDLSDYSNLMTNGIEMRIKIATTFICPTNIVIETLKNFNSKFSQVKIVIEQMLTDEPAHAVLNADADIAISCGSFCSTKLEKIKWRSVKFSAVAAPEHPSNLENIEEEDLNTMQYFIVGGKKMLGTRSYLGSVDDNYVWNLTDFNTKKEFLIHNFGWSYVPEDLVKRELAEGLLVKIKCKKSYLKDLYLFRKKDSKAKPALNYLWSLFQESYLQSNDKIHQAN